MYDYLFETADFSGILIFVAVCVIAALTAFFVYKRFETVKKKRANYNMSGWDMIYTDKPTEDKQENVDYSLVLYSARYDIQGKPDYIFKKRFGRNIMPVEIKSGKIGDSPIPHYGDYLQLCAYFLIIEDVYGIKPKYGRLIYKDYMFTVRNGYTAKRDISRTLGRMRNMLETGTEKPTQSFASCRYCMCSGTVCEFCKDYSGK